MAISLGSIFSNPVWRTKNLITHIGDANAPTPWDFDQSGYASPSNGRTLYPTEKAWMDNYNSDRASMSEANRRAIDDVMRAIFPITGGVIFPTTNTATTSALNWVAPRRDPLVLDLDGDGVETTALVKGAYAGVHFNLDAKGLAEQTGWVGKDDGLLVRDMDGDGKITSGRELFGNHTLLKNGKEAANGFEALKELDSNNDGVTLTTLPVDADNDEFWRKAA
jgi:hypothetical protein